MEYTLRTFDMFDLFFERNETTDLPGELLFSTSYEQQITLHQYTVPVHVDLTQIVTGTQSKHE